MIDADVVALACRRFDLTLATIDGETLSSSGHEPQRERDIVSSAPAGHVSARMDCC